MDPATAPTCTIAREALTPALWAELDPMFAAHWVECGALSKRDPLVPWFIEAEEKGLTRWFIARDGAKAVGYIVFLVAKNPKSQHSLQATCDRFYVEPEHRGEGLSHHLLDVAEAALRAEGVEVVSVSVKPSIGQRALMVWAGYEQSEVVYAKRLK